MLHLRLKHNDTIMFSIYCYFTLTPAVLLYRSPSTSLRSTSHLSSRSRTLARPARVSPGSIIAPVTLAGHPHLPTRPHRPHCPTRLVQPTATPPPLPLPLLATVVIQGLGVGMLSTVPPVFILVLTILGCHFIKVESSHYGLGLGWG